MFKAKLTGVEHNVPDKVLTNFDLEKIVDTSDEWIITRTGIRERRIVEEGVSSSQLAVPAVKKLLEKRGMDSRELDLIIVSTVTPDMFFPSTACLIQEKIGASNAWGFDLSAACSGFLYALTTATNFIESGHYKNVLVCGVDIMSKIVDYEDRTTCVIFGDGAGCVLLERTQEEHFVIDSELHADGSGKNLLYMKAGGSLKPASLKTIKNREHYLRQNGKKVFRTAVKSIADVSISMLEKHHLTSKDIRLFVPHQANIRILEAVAKRMNLPKKKIAITLDRYGNTTSATIPICLSEAQKEGTLKKGDYLLLAAFGGGYTWGSVLLRWAY